MILCVVQKWLQFTSKLKMTKKRKKFLIDLMDDTDSDFADAPKPKAWKRLRKGPGFQNQIKEV